jgi:hypothetical protein
MARLWSPQIKDNPLAFVMYAFPWQVKGTPLENFAGPRKWQREVLLDIAEHIRLNQGKLDFDVLQEAISSGRGIGKSALVSWLVIWMIVHQNRLDDHRVGQLREPATLNHMGRDHQVAGHGDQQPLV